MPAIPPIRHSGKPSRNVTGPIVTDAEFANFLSARRSGRILSTEEWTAKHHNRAPLWRRLLGRA